MAENKTLGSNNGEFPSTKISAITTVEYYGGLRSNKKLKLVQKMINAAYPLIALGFCNVPVDLKAQREIVMFLDHFLCVGKLQVQKNLCLLIKVSLHEMRHAMQRDDYYTYQGFLMQIDQILHINIFDYLNKHDSYSYEIDANLYGNKRSQQYLKMYYPNIYNQQKIRLEFQEKKYEEDYIMYDSVTRIDQAIHLMNILFKLKIAQESDLNSIVPVLNVFFTLTAERKLHFRDLKEIVNDERYLKLDKRIVYAVLSSKTFLESLDISKLSIEELDIIKESLEYTESLYCLQCNHLNEALKNNLTSLYNALKQQKSLLSRLSVINENYDLLIRAFIMELRRNKPKKHKIKQIVSLNKTLTEVMDKTGKITK